jgi:hypothetical protein
MDDSFISIKLLSRLGSNGGDPLTSKEYCLGLLDQKITKSLVIFPQNHHLNPGFIDHFVLDFFGKIVG